MEVSTEAWMRWQSCIQKLWKDYEFPAKTREALNGVFALFRGEGSTFRIDTPSWWMVLDVLRTGDNILDIISITLASRQDLESKIRGGWVITARCPVHQQSPGASQNESKSEVPDNSDLFWYKIEEGGRVSSHCCQVECAGPFKPGSWRVFDTARQCITMKTLEHEVIRLRSAINADILEENSVLKNSTTEAIREKEALQDKLGAMRKQFDTVNTDMLKGNTVLRNNATEAIRQKEALQDKLTVMRKQFGATYKQNTALKIQLHDERQKIQDLRRGTGTGTELALQQQEAAHEAATSIAGNDSQLSSGYTERSQSLAFRSRPQIEAVDLISSAGPPESTSKVLGHTTREKESGSDVISQTSSSEKDRQKRKRDAESVAPDDENENGTPNKRRSSLDRRHGPKVKTEPEA